jgi:oligopeptidase A
MLFKVSQMNPLLNFDGLPRFADIRPEHVTPAVDQLLAEGREAVEKAVSDSAPPTWRGFVAPLEDANEKLGRAWGQVSHLHSVMDSPELREVYNENLPKITLYYAELGQHEGLFAKFKVIKASDEYDRLSESQRKIVDNELRDFRLGGADLPDDKKQRFMEIQEEMARLSAKFEEHLLDATNAYSYTTDNVAELAGLPEDVLAMAKAAAEAEGKPGWKFTLHMPSYMPIMQYAENRALRERFYKAYVTRASELGSNLEWDNTPLISRIIELRNEAALLLGFSNFAEVSLEPKMAETPEQVLDFLNELARRAKPYAEKDMAELKAFAARELGVSDLQAWDNAWASEKLRVARYSFSDNEVKQYFPEPQVLAGMFKVVETIYGLHIRQTSAPTWHKDVSFYEITDHSGAKIGEFYLDLYARASKRGGAWMDDAITRRKKNGAIQTPVAYLNCNFAPPIGNKPALFTHDEVITLFHEFGHGLHHLLTRIEDLGVSGINGVEWDAVELPSQFMENFCWEWDVVRHMAKHVDTGATLPRELFDKMLAAKNFQSGMQTVRQIEFSLFDMHLHYDLAPGKTALQLVNEIRAQVAVVVPPAYNRFPNSFSHIFAGGYAAGYYSYKWAEVLSADAYALFEENGVLNPEVGHRFWSEILAQGGARPAIESFKAFRGREPAIDALLRHNGMA